MGKLKAAITGVQGFVPEDVLTNAQLEQMVDTTEEWIITRTGIKERRILKGEGKGPSDMAAVAITELLEKRQIDPMEIDLLIFATVTPDMIFPATANITAHKAGLINAFGFDVNAACSGWLYALDAARNYIESGAHQKIIVAGFDKMSSIVDYNDRTTCVLFGDGGGAVLLEPHEEYGIQDTIMKSDGSGWVHLHQKAGGSVLPPSHETVEQRLHYIYQEGSHVFKAAVSQMAKVSKEIMDKNHLSAEEIAFLVPHQANLRIIDAVRRNMELPEEKVMINIEKFGNTTNGTIPLCLWEWEDQLNPGDNLILSAFGGGFTWGAVYLKWAYRL